MAKKYIQGVFNPAFPHKYKGNAKNIIYRSSWEKKIMSWMDSNDNILEWSSEELIIWYTSPIDNRRHRYFPDFYVKARDKDGNIKEMLLEVKPAAQTKPPEIPSRKTKRFITEVSTFGINQSKWAAADQYCKDRGWLFQVVTENEIFPGRRKK